MRIIAGEFRGLRLASLGKGDANAQLRPTSDRVRENIFNLLLGGAFGDPLHDAQVLDLFAGTGALGLESLSRGAAHATFVDDGPKALSLIRQNIDLCRAQDRTLVLHRNATRLGKSPQDPFNLVFLDPPYGKGLGEKALAGIDAGGWLAPNALIVLEEGKALPAPNGFRCLDQRTYGATHLHILQAAQPE